MMRIIPFDSRYRDDMIFMVLQAKDALGRVPRLNEDLLDLQRRYLDPGDGFWLAINDQDRVIGCIGVQINDASARLRRLYVKADLKRQGIGTRLLQTAERFAVKRGAENITVHMGDPKDYWESIFFYRKHGYMESGDRWMKKHLGVLSIQADTLAFSHAFYQKLVQDENLFADPAQLQPYHYAASQVDVLFEKHSAQKDRKDFAVLLDQEVIGQIILKHIDENQGSCEISICLARDQYKNRGYGTRAEALLLEKAFGEMQMKTIYANCTLRNIRSQHVLESLGFRFLRQDKIFRYYELRNA